MNTEYRDGRSQLRQQARQPITNQTNSSEVEGSRLSQSRSFWSFWSVRPFRGKFVADFISHVNNFLSRPWAKRHVTKLITEQLECFLRAFVYQSVKSDTT